jgi:hypothetical protein
MIKVIYIAFGIINENIKFILIVGAAISMTYSTGKPIIFVGVG